MSRTDDKAKVRLDDLERVINNCSGEMPYEALGAARQLIANARAHQRQDRSEILRMAGNIAAGIVSRQMDFSNFFQDNTTYVLGIAGAAVTIARAILAEVDGTEEP